MKCVFSRANCRVMSLSKVAPAAETKWICRVPGSRIGPLVQECVPVKGIPLNAQTCIAAALRLRHLTQDTINARIKRNVTVVVRKH